VIFGNWFTQSTYLTLGTAIFAVIIALLERWPQVTMILLFVVGISLVTAAPVFLMRDRVPEVSGLDQFSGKGKLALALGTAMIIVFLAKHYFE
jgi:hypothetical protein